MNLFYYFKERAICTEPWRRPRPRVAAVGPTANGLAVAATALLPLPCRAPGPTSTLMHQSLCM